MAQRVIRGKILDKDGNALAYTEVAPDGTQTRVYPHNDLYAHVLGYDSNGKAGLESVENFRLLTSNAFFVDRIINEFRDEKNIGDNVVTTLDPVLQSAAYHALGNQKGAVIVMEANTGKILALVSKSAFNPNTIVADWETLQSDENATLLNRAMQGAYPPGSTFKIVTTLEYMRENPNYAAFTFDCEGAVTYDGVTIHCFDNKAHGHQDLNTAFANSCNSAFVSMGLELNMNQYVDTARQLLFDKELPEIMPCRTSRFMLTESSESAEIMMTAMGQGQTSMSPYHMALITSAIANGGILMEPYMVSQIVSTDGAVISEKSPKKYADLMTSAEAAQLKAYMTSVVTMGTGTPLNGGNYTAAGKTGTAEYSSDKTRSHSWFTGFSNVDNPELVISVVIEGADNSGARSISVVKEVFNAYY